jgi:hypothetical protein
MEAGELNGSSTSETQYMIVRHDAWCPMAYGKGATCYCVPVFELASKARFAALVQRDMRNRAQRRADAKRARRAR